MRDPGEGISPDGTIVTGVGIDRVTETFRPVLDAAVAAIRESDPAAALYVYGSVASGQAEHGRSDVDLLAIGLSPTEATRIATDLSARFTDVCRAVDIATTTRADLDAETDEAHGGRVFLRHYCVHLSGPDHAPTGVDHPADARAARGFNGDIARHAQRWRSALAGGGDAGALARTVARKTLLAVAGLVSVRDRTWTTDRESAASRWAELEPGLAPGLELLTKWSNGAETPGADVVRTTLDETVAAIVAQFADLIGLWDDDAP